MSILLAAADETSEIGILIAVAAAVFTTVVAWLLGVFRPASFPAGRRVPAGRPLSPLLGILFAAVVVWLVVPTLYLGPPSPDLPASGTPVTGTPVTGPPVAGSTEEAAATRGRRVTIPAKDLIFLSVVGPALALLVMVLGDALVRPRVGQTLGLGASRLPRGAVLGVAGIVIALPIVYASMQITEAVYRFVRYTHPDEHNLLKAIHDSPEPTLKLLAVLAAVVVAPLWEELLFRGHVQMLIREMLIRLRERVAGVEGQSMPSQPEASQPVPSQPVPSQPEASQPRPIEAWISVVAASLLFAGVHDAWTSPPIFILSLCLGFAYERTGNLWVPVVMHASFNGIMTSFFLAR